MSQVDLKYSRELKKLTVKQVRFVYFLMTHPELTNKELGEGLNVCAGTVCNYMNQIAKRLDISPFKYKLIEYFSELKEE